MKTLFTAFLVLFTSIVSYGQSISYNDQVAITIAQVAELRVKPGEAIVSEYVFDTGEKYENDIAVLNAVILQVRTNDDWILTVKSGSENFTYSGSEVPSPVMPASELKVKYQGNPRIPLSTTEVQVNTGTAGTWENNETNMRYIATPRFKYPAGTYTIPVVYTVSNP